MKQSKTEKIKIGNLKHELHIITTITGKRYVCEESLHKVLSILTGLDGYEGLENLIADDDYCSPIIKDEIDKFDGIDENLLWKTKDGRIFYIAEMGSNHLLNIYRKYKDKRILKELENRKIDYLI